MGSRPRRTSRPRAGPGSRTHTEPRGAGMATDPEWRAEATFVAAPASVSSARDFVTQQLVEHQRCTSSRTCGSSSASSRRPSSARPRPPLHRERLGFRRRAAADHHRCRRQRHLHPVGMPPVLGLAGSGSTIVDHLTRDRRHRRRARRRGCGRPSPSACASPRPRRAWRLAARPPRRPGDAPRGAPAAGPPGCCDAGQVGLFLATGG